MRPMSRARNAVLRHRELLIGAALVVGCKHPPPPREPVDRGDHSEGYQVSDPVVEPCRVDPGVPVVTIERVRLDGGDGLRVVPVSPDVQISIAGGSFAKVVEIQAPPGAGIALDVVVHHEGGGHAACAALHHVLRIEPGELPALGAKPKPFTLPE